MSEKLLRFTRSCLTATLLVGLLMTYGAYDRALVTFGVPMLMASVLTMAIDVLVDLMLGEKDHERND